MSFIVKYRVKGEKKTRKVSLGEVPRSASATVIGKMRELARDTLARARVGEDIQPKERTQAVRPATYCTGRRD